MVMKTKAIYLKSRTLSRKLEDLVEKKKNNLLQNKYMQVF